MDIRNNNYRLYTPINFNQKTKIFSDFDGTYMPTQFNHDSICSTQPTVDRNKFQEYFNDFDSFLKSDDIDLTITTGRNLHEFNYFMKKIKQLGLSIPLPNNLIIINGGDKYKRSEEDYFSSENQEMFEEKNIDFIQREKLKKYVRSWDGDAIKQAISDFISNLPFNLMQLNPKTHQGMFGYKDNLTLQENLTNLPDKLNYTSLRDDGFYQIRLTAPNNSPYLNDLKHIPELLSSLGFDISSDIIENDGETYVNSIQDPNSCSTGTNILIKPETNGKITTLDKFHHVKLALEEAQEAKSDDLIIVCGDGENDIQMLDLSNYIDGMQDSNDFSKEEFKEEIENLPMISIFVRNKTNANLDEKIAQLQRNLNFDGKTRFIVVNGSNENTPHSLLEALKQAKESYEENENNSK